MKARCLCGATQFEVQLRNHEVAACHCSMCRRQTGGPLMAIDIEDIHFVDQQYLSVFNSSEWAERGFCGVCGTFIFGEPKITHLPISMFLHWRNYLMIWILIWRFMWIISQPSIYLIIKPKK